MNLVYSIRPWEEQVVALAASFPAVEKLVLFGSRARGDHDERSDIDLAVFCPDMGQALWADLVYRLKNELDTLLKFDVVRFDELSESLCNRITEEGVVLYVRS